MEQRVDLLVLRLLSAPKPDQRPAWFVLDELASLQRLPQLHTAITENRKSKNPLILGFQGKAQLETIYGHLAEVMLSQPATKIFLKTTEPKAAEWVSKAIGQVEIERMRETHQHGTREGRSFTIDRQTEPLVMDSEVSGLPDKHAFLKLGNHVARFNFPYCDVRPVAPAFLARAVEDDELEFDPLTLRPRRRESTLGDPVTHLAEEATFVEDPDDEVVQGVEAAPELAPVPLVSTANVAAVRDEPQRALASAEAGNMPARKRRKARASKPRKSKTKAPAVTDASAMPGEDLAGPPVTDQFNSREI